MIESTTMTVRLTKRLKNKLEKLAKSTRRSKSFLAAEAIKEFLDLNEWQIKEIKAGIKTADEGRLVEHGKVKQWVESWGTDKELERPNCD